MPRCSRAFGDTACQGQQERGNDSRKRELTACAEHVRGASGTPRFPGKPRKARLRFYYEMRRRMTGYALVCLPGLLSAERVRFCLCGYPQVGWLCTNSDGGWRVARDSPALKLNCFVIPILLVFSPGKVNLFISDRKWELQGPSVALYRQCLQAVRAQVAQIICPKEKDLKGGAHHLWNPRSLFPC